MKSVEICKRVCAPLMAYAIITGLTILIAPVGAKTVNIVDSNTLLSAAVADAYSDLDPAVINIEVDSLSTDTQVIINREITINGDADGNGTKCDIVADMQGIMDQTADGVNEDNAFITVAAAGEVNINNIRIHPGGRDGVYSKQGAEREWDRISGIRLKNPPLEEDVGTYTLANVHVSGSDETGTYLDLDTDDDLFGMSGVMRWGGHNGNANGGGPVGNRDRTFSDDAAIHVEDGPGLGTFSSVLDHCHAGLSRSIALSLRAESGTHVVTGGVFGHCARDGIRVAGVGTSIEGDTLDRVRVIRTTNINSDNSHAIEVTDGGELLSLKYVDVATLNSAQCFNFRNGSLGLMEYCRGMGKIDEAGANQVVYIDTANITIGEIRNCTFDALGGFPSPFNVTPDIADPFEVINCIFTSHSNGTVNINTDSGVVPVTFTNCALPTDGHPGESLADPPTGGTGAVFSTPPVSASPMYQATLADYDWSDAQNGDGNADVLRPGNSVAYASAGTNGDPLVGGAAGTEVPVSLSGFTIE